MILTPECLSTQVRSTDGGCICAGALPWWNSYIGACVAAECNAPNSHVEGWYKSDCECDNGYDETGYDSSGEIICEEDS